MICIVKHLLIVTFLIWASSASADLIPPKPTKEQLKKQLTPLQYEVTQNDGTEPPFKNEYWNNHEEGIYVDIVSGEPLFSSIDKYESGTGWPSFTKPLEPKNLITKIDKKLFSTRTEVRSKYANSHLGHVFDDGPLPTGKRYCMNSAAMKFIPKKDLRGQYGQYAKLFENRQNLELATFAGGCFWCMEPPFEKLVGVVSVTSGYTGGMKSNPTYEEVSSGATGHTEAVQVKFDSKIISYEKLLEVFWRSMDPTDADGQFVDRGKQYRPGIFYHDAQQKVLAEKSRGEITKSKKFDKPIVAEITKFDVFYPAEEYHQDYYKKNPIRYKYYRYRSGRDKFLEKHWGGVRQKADIKGVESHDPVKDRKLEPHKPKEKSKDPVGPI